MSAVRSRAGPPFLILTLLLVALHVIHSTRMATQYLQQRRGYLIVRWQSIYLARRSSPNWPLSEESTDTRLGPVFIEYTGTHQHIIVPSNRLILRRAVLVHASWQTLHHSRPFGRDEVRYRVSCSRHAVNAGEAILFRRQCHTMQSRLQRI